MVCRDPGENSRATRDVVKEYLDAPPQQRTLAFVPRLKRHADANAALRSTPTRKLLHFGSNARGPTQLLLAGGPALLMDQVRRPIRQAAILANRAMAEVSISGVHWRMSVLRNELSQSVLMGSSPM
jgi:hypothetical protein